jgi:hypothetical protein
MVERRRHKRYPMPRGTFVILRNKLDPLRNHTQMSIGEIAMVLYKSESEVMGQVTELSLGGIGFDCNFSGIVNADDVELDLLMTEKGIYLHNLPYSTIPIKSAGNGKKRPAIIGQTPSVSKNWMLYRSNKFGNCYPTIPVHPSRQGLWLRIRP